MFAQQICHRSVQALVFIGILASVSSLQAKEVVFTPVIPGSKAPALTFTDVLGVESSSDAYKDHVQIISFATKDTSETLMDWMSAASQKVSSKYPALPLVYLSFADLTEVPSFLRPIAKPILEGMISDDLQSLLDKFKSEPKVAGIAPPLSPEFHLIPDWDGAYLQSFGVKEIDGYYLWVVHQGRVLGKFSHESKKVDGEYLTIFDKLVESQKEASVKKTPNPSIETTDS